MTADELAEHLFDVANQFNRGAARLVDRDEKAQVATIDLRAGRKAKASAAYASACVYFAAGMALLDERDWGSQYELMFSLWLERAECEFLSGNFDKAEQLIVELLQRGVSKVDQAAAYHLKVLLHTVKSEYPQAVASALTCLRLFGIDIPAHPTWEQVQAEYETIWRNLEGRPIESLIDLPLMTDPELQAAMRVLSALLRPAYFTDFHLFCLLACRMVTVSMQHGMSGASAYGCADSGLSWARSFTVTARVIVSPSSPATLSRNTASSPTRRRPTMRWESLPSGHSQSRRTRTGRDGVDVQLQDALVTPSDLPDSLFRYVARTLESVILDDASVQNLFSEDEYVREQRPRSTLCLPLVKQAKLMGVALSGEQIGPPPVHAQAAGDAGTAGLSGRDLFGPRPIEMRS